MKGNLTRRGKNSWRLKFEAGRDPITGKRFTKYVTLKGAKAHTLPSAFPPAICFERRPRSAPDHSKNAYSRDVLKGILISLAAVFVKNSARLVACSAKACI